MAVQELPLFTNADLAGKVVLIRMDHNVVKKGKIKDTMRIDASLPTLKAIIAQGGLPIVMTHVGRPLDKKTGAINISDGDAVSPIVEYIDQQLGKKGLIPSLIATPGPGITDLTPLREAVNQLKAGKADYLYLPNVRWFQGEEAKDGSEDTFAASLASYVDLYVNDAFGSWQPHASTYAITRHLPSFAGYLMQKEVESLNKVFAPRRPFVAVVAGSKFDTKIGPLSSLIKICDHLVLGGVLYKAYLCHKYGFKIDDVSQEDIDLAAKFASEAGAHLDKIVELPALIQTDYVDKREDGSTRPIILKDYSSGDDLGEILDAAPQSFEDARVREVFMNAGTIFVNAVMGFMPLFWEGSSALYSLISQNKRAQKLFGGGDTIQEFSSLLPQIFQSAAQDPNYYFFTGGGAILNAIEQGSPYGMKPVAALIK